MISYKVFSQLGWKGKNSHEDVTREKAEGTLKLKGFSFRGALMCSENLISTGLLDYEIFCDILAWMW